MAQFRNITHVLFDLDGLLLDTNPFYHRVAEVVVNRYGKTFDPTINAQVDGKNAKDSARVIIEAFQLPLTTEAYLTERNTILYDLLPQAQPMPGALQLTQHFHLHQVPQAIATSSARLSFQLKTQHWQDWVSLFEAVIFGDHPAVKWGKPAPDIFLFAAEQLQAEPQHCLVFEDSLAGVAAAKAAGMAVVMVPSSSVELNEEIQADQILCSLSAFEPRAWGLPT